MNFKSPISGSKFENVYTMIVNTSAQNPCLVRVGMNDATNQFSVMLHYEFDE